MRTGAVVTSSNALARLITSDIVLNGGPVIELGLGTGAFTRSILAKGLPGDKLTLVENSPDFTALLRQRFPKAQLLEMDVTRMRMRDDPWNNMQAQAVISGLPLLTMGLRAQWNVVGACMQSLRAGAAMYQFTYMTRCPIESTILGRLGLKAERIGSAMFNLPPRLGLSNIEELMCLEPASVEATNARKECSAVMQELQTELCFSSPVKNSIQNSCSYVCFSPFQF